MTQQQTVVPGKRTITRRPTAEPDKRREGRIAADGYADKVWQGGTIGEVCDQMNHDLGKVDDGDYDVQE